MTAESLRRIKERIRRSSPGGTLGGQVTGRSGVSGSVSRSGGSGSGGGTQIVFDPASGRSAVVETTPENLKIIEAGRKRTIQQRQQKLTPQPTSKQAFQANILQKQGFKVSNVGGGLVAKKGLQTFGISRQGVIVKSPSPVTLAPKFFEEAKKMKDKPKTRQEDRRIKELRQDIKGLQELEKQTGKRIEKSEDVFRIITNLGSNKDLINVKLGEINLLGTRQELRFNPQETVRKLLSLPTKIFIGTFDVAKNAGIKLGITGRARNLAKKGVLEIKDIKKEERRAGVGGAVSIPLSFNPLTSDGLANIAAISLAAKLSPGAKPNTAGAKSSISKVKSNAVKASKSGSKTTKAFSKRVAKNADTLGKKKSFISSVKNKANAIIRNVQKNIKAPKLKVKQQQRIANEIIKKIERNNIRIKQLIKNRKITRTELTKAKAPKGQVKVQLKIIDKRINSIKNANKIFDKRLLKTKVTPTKRSIFRQRAKRELTGKKVTKLPKPKQKVKRVKVSKLARKKRLIAEKKIPIKITKRVTKRGTTFRKKIAITKKGLKRKVVFVKPKIRRILIKRINKKIQATRTAKQNREMKFLVKSLRQDASVRLDLLRRSGVLKPKFPSEKGDLGVFSAKKASQRLIEAQSKLEKSRAKQIGKGLTDKFIRLSQKEKQLKSGRQILIQKQITQQKKVLPQKKITQMKNNVKSLQKSKTIKEFNQKGTSVKKQLQSTDGKLVQILKSKTKSNSAKAIAAKQRVALAEVLVIFNSLVKVANRQNPTRQIVAPVQIMKPDAVVTPISKTDVIAKPEPDVKPKTVTIPKASQDIGQLPKPAQVAAITTFLATVAGTKFIQRRGGSPIGVSAPPVPFPRKWVNRFLRIVKKRRFTFIPDMYSILFNIRAKPGEKIKLLRRGRVFTGLEIRKLVRR